MNQLGRLGHRQRWSILGCECYPKSAVFKPRRVWLLPVVTPPVTQRQIVELLAEQVGHPIRIQVLPKLAIQAIGLFDANLRELVEMLYQYTEPQIVISREFERTFGWGATPLDVALRATLDWYRQSQ